MFMGLAVRKKVGGAVGRELCVETFNELDTRERVRFLERRGILCSFDELLSYLSPNKMFTTSIWFLLGMLKALWRLSCSVTHSRRKSKPYGYNSLHLFSDCMIGNE